MCEIVTAVVVVRALFLSLSCGQLLGQVTMARFTVGLDGDNRVNGG